MLIAVLLAVAGMIPSYGAVNAPEQAIFNLMKNHNGQRRAFVTLDPVLCEVARAKAADMATRGYYDHTDPNGHGPNWWVRQAGYPLPASYSQAPNGNNIESLTAGRDSAAAAWGSWMDSDPHRAHLLAESSFFSGQTSVGVGYVHRPGSQWTTYWVVLTAPPAGPSLAIKSPAAGTVINDAAVTVTGTAGDKPAATLIQARVENSAGNGEWIDADGITDWSVALNGMLPGANTVRVRSLNAEGEELTDATRSLKYVLLAPLTVNTTGAGTIADGFAGTTDRAVGESLRITAKPAAGWIFSHWSGGASSTEPTINLTMTEGLEVTAHFIANPFAAGSGTYLGLTTPVRGTASLLQLQLTENGRFTGKLRFHGGTATVRGSFDATGNVFATSNFHGEFINFTLHYTTENGVPRITGTVAGDGWLGEIAVELQAPAGQGDHKGRYTLVLRAEANAPANVPAGDGFATARVSGAGATILTGTLADGTRFSSSGRITAQGELPVYLKPYQRKGLLAGVLRFDPTESSDLEGRLTWTRPGKRAGKLFPEGFTTTFTAVGARYNPPQRGESVVTVASGTDNTELELGEGSLLERIVQPTTLSPDNTVSVSAPNVEGLSVRVSGKSGQYQGEFVHPVTQRKTKFRGVIVQKQNAGYGFFLDAGASGYASFGPR